MVSELVLNFEIKTQQFNHPLIIRVHHLLLAKQVFEAILVSSDYIQLVDQVMPPPMHNFDDCHELLHQCTALTIVISSLS